MEVQCPACAARYTADDDKIRGRTARMRCRACGTVWLVADDATDEDRHAAVSRRRAERDRRDLFAPRPSDHGHVGETIPPPAPAPGIAARRESSVLFTLDALKDSARRKTPEPQMSPVSDAALEGVIDLGEQLASVPLKALGRAAPAPVFASEPPPAAFAVDATGSSPSATRGRIPMRLKKIGLGAAVAAGMVLLVVGIASAFKGEEPVAHRTATTVVTPAPAAAATPDPAPTTDPTAASTSTADDAKAHTKKGKHYAGKGVASFHKGQADAPAAAKPPPPVKAADPCGCHGDFDCILRCTAKGK
jgi:predicted Zn finger-like uncharacterized protein